MARHAALHASLVVALALVQAPARASAPETADVPERPAEVAGEEGPEPTLHVGGALRFNFFYKTWEGQEANRDRVGDFGFDTFRINVDGAWKTVSVSAEYRLYAGYHMLHHGWVGYQPTPELKLVAGVSRVPFGLLPYASHNWFFDLPYYLGLEDDYDLGVLGELTLGALDLRLAFYKNDEGSFSGSSTDSARYSYDVVRATPEEVPGLDGPRTEEEANQVNLRVAWTFDHGARGATEVGLSGQIGQLHDTTGREGTHWAGAAHVEATLGPWNVQLEGIYYDHDPKLAAGRDDRFVVMGAYDAPYRVARRGVVVVANVAYTLELGWGALDSLTFYNDYSWMEKLVEGYRDSQQDVLGVLVSTGPVYTHLDVAAGRNHPWISRDYQSALAEGRADSRWHVRFNVNLGYYF